MTSQTRLARTAGFLHLGQSRRRAAAVNIPSNRICRPNLTAASTGTPSKAEEPRYQPQDQQPVYTDTLTSSCDGAPGQQDRLRDGSGPVRLRPRPLGLTALGDSSIAAHLVARSSSQLGAPAAQRGRTRLTAASSDTQSGSEEALGKEADQAASQPRLPVRRWTLRGAGDTPI